MSDTPRTDDLRNARLVHAANHPTLGLEGEDLIRAQLERLIDEPPSFLQFARQLERELAEATAELAATKAKLDFLKSKGLTVGMMKTSDKPEPYLVYVIEPESELCNLELVHKLIDADIERDRTKEQLRVAREQIRCAIETMELCRGGLDCGEYSAVDESLANAACNLKPFTQPNLSADSLGGGSPAKGEGGVPLTFPA